MARGADVARRADVARGTRDGCDATRKATWQPARAHAMQGGADTWQGPRKSMRMPGWCHVAGGLAGEGPTG